MADLKSNVNCLELKIKFRRDEDFSKELEHVCFNNSGKNKIKYNLPVCIGDAFDDIRNEIDLSSYLVYNQKKERILTILEGTNKRNFI